MQWLLHGSITNAATDALRRHEQKPHDFAESELAADAPAESVLAYATKRQWDLLTTDAALVGHAIAGASPFRRCIVYLHVDAGDVEQDDAVDRLFTRFKRLTPGRLYTVTASRTKVRQLPGV